MTPPPPQPLEVDWPLRGEHGARWRRRTSRGVFLVSCLLGAAGAFVYRLGDKETARLELVERWSALTLVGALVVLCALLGALVFSRVAEGVERRVAREVVHLARRVLNEGEGLRLLAPVVHLDDHGERSGWLLVTDRGRLLRLHVAIGHNTWAELCGLGDLTRVESVARREVAVPVKGELVRWLGQDRAIRLRAAAADGALPPAEERVWCLRASPPVLDALREWLEHQGHVFQAVDDADLPAPVAHTPVLLEPIPPRQ